MRRGGQILGLVVALTTPAAAKRPPPPGPTVIEPLLDRLALGEPQDQAVAALDVVRDPRAVSVLARYARHLDPVLRVHAVASLAAIADPRAGEAVRAALGDPDAGVRAAAAAGCAARADRAAVPSLLALLGRGDEGAAVPLAALADAGVAMKVAELVGTAPDPILARALGAMLLRRDLGPDSVYVGVVRALAAIPGEAPLTALRAYLDSKPPATSGAAREAQALYQQRAGGR